MVVLETLDKEIQLSKKSKGYDPKDKTMEDNSEETDKDVRSSEDEVMSKDERNSDDGRTAETANAGWADVMRKILKANKPKRKKTIVLSKAKKLTGVKAEEESSQDAPFDIEAKTKDSKAEISQTDEPSETKADVGAMKKKRKNVQNAIRVKPSFHDRQRERLLQKIATKGVVQLFNVVKQQQMEIEEKVIAAGPLERKREKALSSIDKRAFLDVLMGGSKSISVDQAAKRCDTEKKEDNEPDKVWSVLRDDFTMGAKLKDWDKKAAESEDDSTSSEEMDSD